MDKRYKHSSSILTKCLRFNKKNSRQIPTNNNNNITCPLSSVIETIQTIDQLVQSVENNSNKQQNDSKTMNIDQIEEMLIKWAHIAYFLIDTYQKIQS